jgi:hypothetical protein
LSLGDDFIENNSREYNRGLYKGWHFHYGSGAYLSEDSDILALSQDSLKNSFLGQIFIN